MNFFVPKCKLKVSICDSKNDFKSHETFLLTRPAFTLRQIMLRSRRNKAPWLFNLLLISENKAKNSFEAFKRFSTFLCQLEKSTFALFLCQLLKVLSGSFLIARRWFYVMTCDVQKRNNCRSCATCDVFPATCTPCQRQPR